MNDCSFSRFQNAMNILELTNCEDINEEQLRRQYRKLALKYHPDKNKDANTTQKFQEISHSYMYLSNRIKQSNKPFVDINEKETDEEYNHFKDTIYCIVEKWLKKENMEEPLSIHIKHIISIIADVCELKILPIIEKIDHQIDCWRKRRDGGSSASAASFPATTNHPASIIILKPTLKDLFENNLYKLVERGDTYIVPMWHREITFEDNSGNEIWVNCEPQLPENVVLDEKNNLHVDVTCDIKDLLDKEIFEVCISSVDDIFVSLNVDSVKLKRSQIIILEKQGISAPNPDDVYDISQKGDILLNIHFQTI